MYAYIVYGKLRSSKPSLVADSVIVLIDLGYWQPDTASLLNNIGDHHINNKVGQDLVFRVQLKLK